MNYNHLRYVLLRLGCKPKKNLSFKYSFDNMVSELKLIENDIKNTSFSKEEFMKFMKEELRKIRIKNKVYYSCQK